MALITVSEVADGVARITLNRPEKRNALSTEMRDQLLDVLDRLGADEGVRVLVITGAGPVFCAGFDLTEMAAATPVDPGRTAASDRFHHALFRFPVPVVAAINGPALGGGFDVAVLTDLRIASDTAHFAHPEYTWGEVIYRPLRDLVGGAVARELVLTGRRIDAEEALAVGLVSWVVPSDTLADTATELAARIAAAPREVLVRMKTKMVAATGIPATATTLEL